MTSELKPHHKYQQVCAILRYVTDADPSAPIEYRIAVKKIVTDPDYAAREVTRLNELNKDKGAYYFYRVTRFEEVPILAEAETALQGSTAESPPA